jgi:hypothetical protein
LSSPTNNYFKAHNEIAKITNNFGILFNLENNEDLIKLINQRRL